MNNPATKSVDELTQAEVEAELSALLFRTYAYADELYDFELNALIDAKSARIAALIKRREAESNG